MEENHLAINDKITSFFKDKIFIYALITALISYYFYFDHARYPFDNEIISTSIIEIIVSVIIYISFIFIEKKSLKFESKMFFKYSILFSFFMIIIYYTSSLFLYIFANKNSSIQGLNFAIAWLIGRTIIIYMCLTATIFILRTSMNCIKAVLNLK